MRTLGKALRAVVPAIVLRMCLPLAAIAQEVRIFPDGGATPSAMTLSVRGRCYYSQDGVTFTNLERGHSLRQGAVVRTGADARADLFFRRTGITVRLQEDTEIKLERMTAAVKAGLPVEDTLLDIRAGRIFTVVRSELYGSVFEIRNAAGRAVVEGGGIGRYIITADGTHVTAKGSVVPLKVIGESGVTLIMAGQQFAHKDGKVLPVDSNSWVKDMIQIDELEAITETAKGAEPSPKP